MSPRFEKYFLLLLMALWLLTCLAMPANLAAQTTGDRVVNPSDVVAAVAFSFLKREFLPKETRMTSGFRTSQDQVRVIRDYADLENIPVPAEIRADDRKLWEPILKTLRERGYIIAEPGKSPHEDQNQIVLDLSGASLDGIVRGCQRAEQKGVIKLYRKITEHKNHAVHVEFDLKAAALSMMGFDPQLAKSHEDSQTLKNEILAGARERALQEPDPVRRAARLRVIQKTSGLVDYGDPTYLRLQAEIDENQKQADQLLQDAKKQNALKAIDDAQEQGDWETAEQKADEFVKAFGGTEEAKNIIPKVQAQKYYQKAVEIAYPLDEPPLPCESCQDALSSVMDAISALENATPKLPAKMEGKLRDRLIQKISKCRSQFWLKVALWAAASLVILIGLFFVLRPGALILHCEDGDQHGESFALDQPAIIIGSLGPPDGKAQIVISDRKHKISRCHCIVKQSGRRFYLKDHDSSNGTSVNGRRLEEGEYRELKKGDEISLAGAAILIVRRR